MKHISTSLPNLIRAKNYTESPIEVILFNEMMRSGKFVLCQESDNPSGEGLFMFPQLQVGQYRSDFIIRAIGYPGNNRIWPPRLTATICVECDGAEFHTTPEQINYDKKRDEYFLSIGIKTIRFTGAKIYENSKFCVDEIIHNLDIEMKNSI